MRRSFGSVLLEISHTVLHPHCSCKQLECVLTASHQLCQRALSEPAQRLFALVQRSTNANERVQRAHVMAQRDVFGFTLGGFGSGESSEQRAQTRSPLRCTASTAQTAFESSLMVHGSLYRINESTAALQHAC